MSKNNKNRRLTVAAKQMSAQRKAGNPGPKRTEAKHGKRNTWHAKLAGKVAAKPATVTGPEDEVRLAA